MRRATLALFCCMILGAAVWAQPSARETVVIDASAPGTPLPHFWERIFGSGRAILTVRDSYRTDLRQVRDAVGMQYVRFHAIFHDEVGVYDEDKTGKPLYNFSYVDQIYDGLLQNGVRPFVEISFMPKKLSAAPPVVHPFWYAEIVSPPKDWQSWDDLITAFAQHLLDRYGADEISRWYFEVWNEPNIDFWAGDPKWDTYLELYDHTARDLKKVSPRFRVGGPATARAAWVDRFIAHAVSVNVPLDFVSTHVYANDSAENVFGTNEAIPREHMVCRAVRKVHDEVKASERPELPLIFSEYNASYANEPNVTDSVYMGPWLANTVRECDGLVDEMAYWTFSDVFEEQGVVKTPFYGGFGLLAERGIPKPSFNAFILMHRLGTERLKADSSSVLATRAADRSLAVLAWNLVPLGENGAAKSIRLQFRNVKAKAAQIWRVDQDHGNALKLFRQMGSPKTPTVQQIRELQAAGSMSPAEPQPLANGVLDLSIPPDGLVLVQVK